MSEPNFEHLPENMKQVVLARKKMNDAYAKVNSKNVKGDKYMMSIALQQAQMEVREMMKEVGPLKVVS